MSRHRRQQQRRARAARWEPEIVRLEERIRLRFFAAPRAHQWPWIWRLIAVRSVLHTLDERRGR